MADNSGMKFNILCRGMLLTVAPLFAPTWAALAETVAEPQVASLTLVKTAPNSPVLITITNAGDGVWVLEGSANLSDWNPLTPLKVYNGWFRQSVDAGSDPGKKFYRLSIASGSQTSQSDVDQALLLPATPFNYVNPALPPSFFVQPILGQDNQSSTNTITDAGATLGRVLFYDRRLSTNRMISCSSCHQQQHGFADPRQFSTGFGGGTTTRNAMGLSNARWYERRHFFWDERADTLEDQVLQPIQNPVEMGMTLDAVTARLAAEPFYTNLFAQAFGTTDVTAERISLSLAQFVRSIVSTHSKYDEGVTHHFANFTAQEELGRQIFFGRIGNATCAQCHGSDNFVPGPKLNNNGLEFPYVDKGVGAITGLPQDNGKFKVPSLRNIALTAPYMHDGRFATLEQVVEFYNSGVVENPNLSPPLRGPDGLPLRLNLTPEQKTALVAFLNTLTDPSLPTDASLSDPFNYGD